LKNQIDIKLHAQIGTRYNAAPENWSKLKWLEVEPGVAIRYLD